MQRVVKYPLRRIGLTTAIVTTDTHVPVHCAKMHKAVCNYARDLNPDYWIDLGDLMEYHEISRHVKGNIRAITNATLEASNKVGRKILDDRQAAAPNAKFIQLEGNHDKRPEDLIDVNPVMQGLVEIENTLDFAGRNIDYIRYWSNGQIVKLGKAYFGHGKYVTDYHAKKTVDSYGKNFFYGHTHDIQSYSKVWDGDGETRIGQSLGCGCRYDLDYKKGNPDRWQQAVTTFYFRPNGLFNYFISPVFEGNFIAPNGRLYTPQNNHAE